MDVKVRRIRRSSIKNLPNILQTWYRDKVVEYTNGFLLNFDSGPKQGNKVTFISNGPFLSEAQDAEEEATTPHNAEERKDKTMNNGTGIGGVSITPKRGIIDRNRTVSEKLREARELATRIHNLLEFIPEQSCDPVNSVSINCMSDEVHAQDNIADGVLSELNTILAILG